MEVHRFGLQDDLIALADGLGLPIATTILGKSVISECHPLFVGVYEGEMGRAEVTEFVEESDCLLMLGCPHAAHDAVGETLLRGWRDLSGAPTSGCPRLWLYGLATHVCLEDVARIDESRRRGSFDGVRDANEPAA